MVFGGVAKALAGQSSAEAVRLPLALSITFLTAAWTTRRASSPRLAGDAVVVAITWGFYGDVFLVSRAPGEPGRPAEEAEEVPPES